MLWRNRIWSAGNARAWSCFWSNSLLLADRTDVEEVASKAQLEGLTQSPVLHLPTLVWVILFKIIFSWSLLLLLSQVSHVRPCATPEMAAHQAPPSLGLFQAKILEWVANSFSSAWKWKVKVKSLSRVRLLATPWTVAYQAPPSMGFPRQEYWSGLPLPFPLKPKFSSVQFSRSVVSDSLRLHESQHARPPCP